MTDTTAQTAPEQKETHRFEAEIQQLLDIVVHSLYKDREIFVRELVSNAADALEKLRMLELTEKDILDADLEREIRIELDEENRTIAFADTGVGMTHDELVENLGTIAHSGSRAFMQQLSEAMKEGEKPVGEFIGQFGLGFYSAFMVAERVEVETRSYRANESGHVWLSDGAGEYTIEEREGLRRGTRIVVHLKEGAEEFAKKSRVESIVKKYSNFVSSPVFVGDERINAQQALWTRSKSDITDEEYEEFYRFVGGAFDEPMMRLHFSADAPLAINAVLFVPGHNSEGHGMTPVKSGVALYCNKVLIEKQADELLPEWLRFLRGVIDSPDLPLSVSRETMQDSALRRKLGKVITNRVLRWFAETAKKDEETYAKFFGEFGGFLKEAVINGGHEHQQDIAKLLRFESSKTERGKRTSFEKYIERMADGQEEFYFLNGPSRTAIEAGPYMEAFRSRDIEVFYTFEPVDDFALTHLAEFDGKKFKSADEADLNLPDRDEESNEEALPKEDADSLAGWLLAKLGDKVSSVRTSDRLTESPAVAVNDAGISTAMQRMMHAMRERGGGAGDEGFGSMPIKVRLEINPSHDLIRRLAVLRKSDEFLAEMVAHQLLDNTLIAAGLLLDPRPMLGRLNDLLTRVADAGDEAEVEVGGAADSVASAEETDHSNAAEADEEK